jgi:hypothetical protein
MLLSAVGEASSAEKLVSSPTFFFLFEHLASMMWQELRQGRSPLSNQLALLQGLGLAKLIQKSVTRGGSGLEAFIGLAGRGSKF